MEATPDFIEKRILLRAPAARVWRALSDSKQFGTWFGASFDEPFRPGALVRGKIAPTQVDAAVARAQAPYAGAACDLRVEEMEPERRLRFRWAAVAPEPGENPASLPTTRVEFLLTALQESTILTVIESGFHALPLETRARAFTGNQGGWELQLQLISKYLSRGG